MMQQAKRNAFVVFIILFLVPFCVFAKNIQLKSPDGKITIEISEVGKQLFYAVKKGNTHHLNESKLGIIFQTQDFSKELSIKNTCYKEINEKYEMLTGKRKTNTNFCNELTLEVENPTGAKIDIIFRAYNDGIAFRYGIKNQSTNLIAKEEVSEFNLPSQTLAWIQRYAWWAPAYEQEFENKIRVGSLSPQHREDGWSFPALFNHNNSWTLITESNLDRNYCASHIRNKEDSPIYKIQYVIKERDYEGGIMNPVISKTWNSPWRIAIIGELHDIVESNLVFHVADNSKVKNISWINPGKSSWSWLYEPSSPKDYNLLKKSVDNAADFGWEYCLVDANWNQMENGNIQQLIEYANSKNVGLTLWYNSGGKHNRSYSEQPRDIMCNSEKRKAEFAKLQKWGVKGVKIDFFESDKQNIIQLYIDILEDAAQYEIMVNFHGCTLPRGWQKTYPHLMTMEAVKGAEFFLFDKDFPYSVGRHNATLPFTRNVVGSMDYTPVNFSPNIIPHVNTYSHELALSVVFESGILHFGDKAESYQQLPQPVKDFMIHLPTTWDDTKFLSGYPGKSFVVARNKGAKWYVGGINGNFDETEINLDFSFLGDDNYTGKIIKRGDSASGFSYEQIRYPETKTLKFNLIAEDGFVIEFNKMQ